MGLEAGNYVSDLDITNPPSGDQVAQGDDHLRLIKRVLKNTFPTATKAIYFTDAVTKTAVFAITASDMNKTFMVSTAGGAITLVLPVLVSTDAGWTCYFVKTTGDLNPIYLTPPSGFLQSGPLTGLLSTRRCMPGRRFAAFWSGSNWLVERCIDTPVGGVIDYGGGSLPVGFEWPNGQTLVNATTYPDYFLANGNGVTRDLRGVVSAGRDNMGGSAANRLTTAGSGVDGATLGATGGAQAVAIAQANLPAISLSVDIPAGQGSHTHSSNAIAAGGNSLNSGPFPAPLQSGATINAATLPGMSGTASLGGSGVALTNAQPTTVLNKLLVVE